jgi:hypothetical protein
MPLGWTDLGGGLPTTSCERFKHERQYIVRNRGASIMDGEHHGVAVSMRGERDRRSAAVLYRVANEIRYDLGQPVGVPLATQVPAGLQAHDCV